MSNSAVAPVRQWTDEPLSDEVRAAIARLARADDVQRIAVMPDVHLASHVCVGAAVATRRLVYPQAVGGDIGCGIACIAFDAAADALQHRDRSGPLLAEITASIPILRHRSLSGSAELPADLKLEALSSPALAALARREGRIELGTLGRGNHFVEFQADQEGRLWLMVHSGSRAVGQAVLAHHMTHATRVAGGLACLDTDTEMGQAYLNDSSWAARFAHFNRLALVESAASVAERLLGIRRLEGTLLDTDHNHVRREDHGGQAYLIHRKGANRAGEGETGLIPGSMGTRSFHVVGRGCAEALLSSSHGSGRRKSRGQAMRGPRPDIDSELRGVVFDRRLAGRLTDELPSAYKDIGKVMRAQRELVAIRRELHPLLVFKGV